MSRELKAGVAAAVWALVEGPGATIEDIELQPALMALESVIAEADGAYGDPAPREVIASVVATFLEDAADSLAERPDAQAVPNRTKAARAAVNLKAGLQSRPFTGVKGRPGRAERVAHWLGYEAPSLKKPRTDGTTPLGALVDGIAEHLVRREVGYLVNARRLAQRARRPPLESAMRVEWLGRFERYYVIWASLCGVRHDLEMAVDQLRHSERDEAELFIRKSLYYYARYLADLDQFITQRGGLWILPDTTTEDAIADAMWYVRKPAPCNEVDESTLRLGVGEIPEMAPFLRDALNHPDMEPILVAWRDWVIGCRCADPHRPRKDCGVHATIEWSRFYMKALDDQWDFLSDWYDLPRPGTTVDPVRQARRGRHVFPPAPPVDNRPQSG
jgi:hypothetical protein